MGSLCSHCETLYVPPRPLCTKCYAEEMEWQELSGTGKLTGFTAIAIAPGFMITNQNRFLLLDEQTEQLTERGETVVSNVPMRRFGDPTEIVGAVLWLLSDHATFVTGAVIPVDGGFSANCGV